ncbi:aspartic peptidase domain-containing protein [Peziza echinospora]|nr:aspartic peptidase domain-containing protein [Peziza echinospora]
MLSSDFVIHSTTAEVVVGVGEEGVVAFDRYRSESYITENTHVSKNCLLSSDHLALPHDPNPGSIRNLTAPKTVLRIPFVHCHPPPSTLGTLLPSGAVWGLGFASLSQSRLPSVLSVLYNYAPLFSAKHDATSATTCIQYPIWSFATVNTEKAILSLGGTVVDFAPEQEWKWTSLRDQVEGYWEVGAQGVYVNGLKVLRNVQRVVLDVGCPVVVGPPEMVRIIWSFVEGARRLVEVVDYDEVSAGMSEREWAKGLEGYWAYPCMNEPVIQIEFAGWGFPMGRVGLGKVMEGSGYCVGAIVGWPEKDGSGLEEEGQDERVWVLGEPFWENVVGVFDFEKRRVGMRTP